MATISNTVQGLNETVGLLKQILKVVSGDGKKGADAKDVVTTSNMLNGLDESGAKTMGVVISSLESLDKMKEGTDKKAKSLAEAIKILTSKDVIEGLKKYNSISSKVIYNISSIFVNLAEVFDDISNRIDVERIESFVRMIKELTKAIDIMTNVMYKIAGLVVVCAIVGVIAILAWKQILIGFAAITAIAIGIVAITWVLKKTSKITNDIRDSIHFIIDVMFRISILVAMCVIVGAVAILAWKPILIGFAAIVGIALGVVAISWILKMTADLTQQTMVSIVMVVATIMAISILVAVCAIVGVFTILAFKPILIGFAAIVGVAIGIVAISWMLKMTADLTQQTMENVESIIMSMFAMTLIPIVCAIVGIIAINSFGIIMAGFGTIALIVTSMISLIIGMGIIMNRIKLNQYFADALGIKLRMPKEIKDVLTVLTAITLIPIVCVIVGFIAINSFGIIMAGFGTIVLIMSVIVLLIKAINWASKGTEKAKIQISSLIVTVVSIVALVFSIIKLAQFINESQIPYLDILLVVGLMAGIMFGFNMLIKIISKIKISTKEILAIGTIISLIALTIFAVKKIIDLSKEVANVGWGEIFVTLGGIAGVMSAFGVFIAAIGGMMMIPFAPIVFATGAITILTISGLVIMVGNAIKKIVDVYNDCVKSGIKIEDVANIGKKMGLTLSGFVKNIVDGLEGVSDKRMRQIGRMMMPIGKIINTCSKFLKMISSFTTEDCSTDEMRMVIYDEKTGEFRIGHKINVSNAGSSIANGFSIFVKNIVDGLEGVSNGRMRQIGRMMMPVKSIINTCSKFLKMITSFTDGEEGVLYPIKYIEKTNENGEVIGEYVKGEPIHLKNVAGKISTSFIDFCTTLSNGLKIDEAQIEKINDFGKGEIGKIIGACSSFVEMISSTAGVDGDSLKFYITDKDGNYVKDENGNYKTRSVNIKEVGTNISTAFSSFIDSINIDANKAKKTLKKLNESGIDEILKTIGNYTNIISSYSTTNGKLSMLIKDKDGNYMMTSDGKYKTRAIDLSLIGLKIKNGFQEFINNISGIDANNDLGEFAKNFESITNSFDKITKTIFDVADSATDRMKKNTDAINKFADAINKVCESIERLNEIPDKDLSINLNENIKETSDISSNNNSSGTINKIVNEVNNAMAIKEGVIEAFKSIHFELSFDNNDRKSGEIIPVSRGSDINQSNSYAWE